MADQKEELRIKKRLEALKRGGVHRVKEKNPMPSADTFSRLNPIKMRSLWIAYEATQGNV